MTRHACVPRARPPLRRLCAVGLTLATALLVAPAAPDGGLAPASAAEPAAAPVAARTMEVPQTTPATGFRVGNFNVLGADHTAPGGNRKGWESGHRAHGPRRLPAGAEHPRRRRLPGVPAAAGGPLRGADGHVVADLPGPRQPGRPVGQLDRLAHRRVDAPRGAHPPDPVLRRRAEPDAGRAPAERRHRPPRVVLQHPQPGRRPWSGAGLPRRRLRDGGRPRQRAAGGLPRRAVHLAGRQERARQLLLQGRPRRRHVVGERRLRRRQHVLGARRWRDRLDHGHQGRLLQRLHARVERLRLQDQRPPALHRQRRRTGLRAGRRRPRRGGRRPRADLGHRGRLERPG